MAGDVHDMGVMLDGELFGHLDRADLRDPADIVAAEVQQHQVFGQFLGVAQQVGGQRLVLGCVAAALAGAGERADGDRFVAQPDEDFRAGPDDGEAAEIEEEQEGRRVQPPQRAVQGEGRQGEWHLEALAEHHLEHVARLDIVAAALDHAVVIRARHVGHGDRRFMLHRRAGAAMGMRAL